MKLAVYILYNLATWKSYVYVRLIFSAKMLYFCRICKPGLLKVLDEIRGQPSNTLRNILRNNIVHIIHWNGKLHDENNLRTLVRLSIVIWDYLLQDESQYRMVKRNGTHTLPLGAINHNFTYHIWGGIWKRKTRHDLRSRFVNVMGGWFDLIIGFPPYPNGTGIYTGTESVITSDKKLQIGDWHAGQSS